MVENEPRAESEICVPKEISNAPEPENRIARESQKKELAKEAEHILYAVSTLGKEL